MVWRNLSKTAEKSSSSPSTAGAAHFLHAHSMAHAALHQSVKTSVVSFCYWLSGQYRFGSTLAVHKLEELFFGCGVVSNFWLWQETVFGFTSILRVQYMMGCRNRYFEGMEDGQMTPYEYPNFNSYI